MSRNSIICVEGARNVECLLESPRFETQRVFIEEGRHRPLLAQVEELGITCQELSSEMMAGAAGYQFHRGVFAHAKRPEETGFEPENLSKLVVLTHLADEGNLGTIIRTATAFGADGILLEATKGGDPFSRKSIRASSTAVFRTPVFEVESVASTLGDLRKNFGFQVTASETGDDSVSLSDCERSDKMAVVFGAEKDGIPKDILAECDKLTSLPMASGIDSINVAACAAVVLHALFGNE